jgi:hypothetical protein
MSNDTTRNVYLIRQDIDHLFGEYLVRAVVLAAGPGRAIKALLRHLRTNHSTVFAQRSRLTAVQIGANAPTVLEPHAADCITDEATIVAVVFGKDNAGAQRTERRPHGRICVFLTPAP